MNPAYSRQLLPLSPYSEEENSLHCLPAPQNTPEKKGQVISELSVLVSSSHKSLDFAV